MLNYVPLVYQRVQGHTCIPSHCNHWLANFYYKYTCHKTCTYHGHYSHSRIPQIRLLATLVAPQAAQASSPNIDAMFPFPFDGIPVFSGDGFRGGGVEKVCDQNFSLHKGCYFTMKVV